MKNLVNFKVAVKTRECLVQAIYQMLFNDDSVAKVIDQFKDEHKTKKVDFKMFSMSLRSINSCLLYTSPSPRDATLSRMPSSA